MEKSKTVKSQDSSLFVKIRAFQESRNTLQLASINENNLPHISYAPFVHDKNAYFIFVSELAAHTKNILSKPTVSLMMIEDESEAKNDYVRKRLTFDATAVSVSRETKTWSDVLSLMVNKFGETAQVLSQLGDFHLLQLNLGQGLYVEGFGQAYVISAEDLDKSL